MLASTGKANSQPGQPPPCPKRISEKKPTLSVQRHLFHDRLCGLGFCSCLSSICSLSLMLSASRTPLGSISYAMLLQAFPACDRGISRGLDRQSRAAGNGMHLLQDTGIMSRKVCLEVWMMHSRLWKDMHAQVCSAHPNFQKNVASRDCTSTDSV